MSEKKAGEEKIIEEKAIEEKTNEENVTAENITQKQSISTKVAKMGLMIAIACIVGLLKFPTIPSVGFLTYDFADVPCLITSFAFGPVAGFIAIAIVAAMEAFVLGGDGIYGFLMHLVASGSFIVIAGLIYKQKRTKKRAIIGMAIGGLVMLIIMLVLNYYVAPLYYSVATNGESNYVFASEVITDILPLVAAFNIMKVLVDSLMTLFLYKKVSVFLHR